MRVYLDIFGYNLIQWETLNVMFSNVTKVSVPSNVKNLYLAFVYALHIEFD